MLRAWPSGVHGLRHAIGVHVELCRVLGDPGVSQEAKGCPAACNLGVPSGI